MGISYVAMSTGSSMGSSSLWARPTSSSIWSSPVPIPIEAFRTFYFALYLNLYSDLGRVWDSRYAALNPLSNRWINGNGLGLDLVTSYDQVLRAEYSVNSQGDHGFFLHFTQPF